VQLVERSETVELTAVQGNRSHAAKRLGLSRATLINRLNKYGLASRAEIPGP